MENRLQLAVVTPLDELRRREIRSNVKDILPIVQAKAMEYKNTQYGITQEKMCREDRARLNKFSISIAEELKAISEANNEPFVRFAAEVKPITEAITSAIASLDKQLAEMENLWRSNNLENARILYEDIIGTGKCSEWITFEQILITKKTGRTSYEDFFGNKGTWSYPEGMEEAKDTETLKKAGRKVTEVFDSFLNMIIEKNSALQDLDYDGPVIDKGLEYLKSSYDPTKKALDFEGAVRIMSNLKRQEDEKREAVEKAKREAEARALKEAELARIRADEEKQKALLEQQKKLESEKQKAVEEAEKKARENAKQALQQEINFVKNVNAPTPSPEEKRYIVRFETEVTADQAKDLRMFCNSIGIVLKPLK